MVDEERRGKGRLKGYTISAVAERYGVHPQTLRLYEREGLLKPYRSGGNTRYYSEEDLERLELILTLTRDMGVNLAGVEVILSLREQFAKMQDEMTQFLEAVRAELNERISQRTDQRSSALVLRSSSSVLPRSLTFAARLRTAGGAEREEGREGRERKRKEVM